MFKRLLLVLVILLVKRNEGQFVAARNGGQTCSDILGGRAQVSTECQFPFIYKDVSYSDCTRVDDPQGKLWCSTNTDAQDKHRKGNFKLCLTGIIDERKSSDLSTCKFPFIYKNVRYSECITLDASDGKPWCSTKTDSQSNHEKGNFKHCKNSLTSAGASSCKFPFIYKNVRYSECTRKDDPEGKLWCSTKTDSQSNHQKGNLKHCTNLRSYSGVSSCKFPFIYKNVRYSECTRKDDPEGKLWCSTRTDSLNEHQKGSFRHCTGTRSKRSSPVSAFCKFPFIYKNVKYSNCTTIDDPEGLPWCSTRTDSQSKHMMGNLRHCIGPQRTRIYSGTSNCNFPFIYKNQTYFDCTAKDDPERKLWCSTKTDSQKNHQKGNFQHCSVTSDQTRSKAPSSSIVGCKANIAAQEPVDQQIVYLEEEGNPNYWYYVTYNSYAATYEHSKPEIVETDDNWAGWIWHECGGPDIVCLESQEFKHYYFLFEHYRYPEADYTVDPHLEDWTKLKIISRVKTDRGVRMKLVRLTYDGYRYPDAKHLTVIVYVPPYCVGYQKVRTVHNHLKKTTNIEYKVKTGITKTSSTTHEVSLTVAASIGAIAAAGGEASFMASSTYTFTQEESTAEVMEQETTSNIPVDPGESVDIWQKVAKYGDYKWNSLTLLFCPSNDKF